MTVQLYHGDCLEVMRGLEDSSVQLIATDPPYYRVKGEWWDRQWDSADGFLAWIGALCDAWYRVLAPNGSLYVFASPKMAARVECVVGERFNVLNQIVWRKGYWGEHSQSSAHRANKESLRSFNPETERIIFAEHYGADDYAKGEAGYGVKSDELRGFIFEPLRAYLDGERRRAGITYQQANQIIGKPVAGGGMATHYFSDPNTLAHPQWALPTEEHYAAMRDGFRRHNHGGEYLRREYEDLRQEYESLRRPFSVSAEVPYTDVWTFPTVNAYPGKHPCEKPLAMLEHIVTASSREGDTVLDCFCGSGNSGIAAAKHGREYIGIDIQKQWVATAERRIAAAQLQMCLPLDVPA